MVYTVPPHTTYLPIYADLGDGLLLFYPHYGYSNWLDMMKWREYAGIIHFRQIIHLSYILLRRRQIAPVVTCLWGYEGAWLDNRAHGHGTFTESSGTSYEGQPVLFFFFQGKWCIQTKVDSPTSPIVINKCRGRWDAMIFRRVSSSHIPLQWSFFPWSFSVPAHRTPRRAVAPRSEAWLRQVARQQKKTKKY
jgi:hypothetical protein